MSGAAPGDPGGPALIGIDVGTTSIRAIAFAPHGRKLAAAGRPTPLVAAATGGEYDPDAIAAIVFELLAAVNLQLAGRPVASIAVASIGESCVLVDADGRAVAPSIAWFDRRTTREAAAIEGAVGRDRVFALCGHAVDPIFTLAKLLWMRAHWPERMAAARRMLMMADWIAFRLSGEMATDPGLASRTLLYDIGAGAWAAEMLALAGRDKGFPAPLAPSGTPLGRVSAEAAAMTGIAGRPVVAVGGHDHILGAFATGLRRPGTVVNSIGTAEALLLATDAPLRDPATTGRGYVQGATGIDARLGYVCASLFSAGGAMEWLRAATGGPPAADLIAEAAEVQAGSRGVVFLPHLVGGAPPVPDGDARGAFVGLTPAVDRATLYRAVLEGLALQSRLMLDGMASLAGVVPPTELRLIGGVTRNRLFLEVKANAFGRPLTVVEEPEATALGAALLAGLGAGIYPDADAAVGALDRREFTIGPDPDLSAFYDDLRSRIFAPIQNDMRAVNATLAGFRGRAPAASDPRGSP